MSDAKPRDSTHPPGAGEEARPSVPPQSAGQELTPDQLEQCVGGIGDRGVIPDFLR